MPTPPPPDPIPLCLGLSLHDVLKQPQKGRVTEIAMAERRWMPSPRFTCGKEIVNLNRKRDQRDGEL